MKILKEISKEWMLEEDLSQNEKMRAQFIEFQMRS